MAEKKSEIRVNIGSKTPDRVKQIIDALDTRAFIAAALATAAFAIIGKFGNHQNTYYEPIKLPSSGQFLGYFDDGAEFLIPPQDVYGLDCGHADRPLQLDKEYEKSIIGSDSDAYGGLYRVVCKDTDRRNTLEWIKSSEMPFIPEKPSDNRPVNPGNSETS